MRVPKPFLRKQTGTWYVQIGKKQHSLGADKEEAFQQYHLLMAGRQVASSGATAVDVIGLFLDWNRNNRAADTHEFYSRPLLSFASHIGTRLLVKDVKPFHVTEWLQKAYAGQSDNYRRNAIRAVQRAFSWAVDEGRIEKSPVARIKKPAATPRDVLISPEQWAELVTALKDRGDAGEKFLEMLSLMRVTGCRPKEARDVEAKHVDKESKCIIFERELSKGFGGGRTVERRVVPLTDSMFDLCARLAVEYPSGQIFRNSAGQPWDRYQIKDWFKRLDASHSKRKTPLLRKSTRKQKLSFRPSAYAIRHTWATEALKHGVDPITVATIMGHKDLTQLMKTYQHLKRKGPHLRAMLSVAIGETPASPVAGASQS